MNQGPIQDNEKLWRYMDLTKFLSLLQDQALYFSCLSDLAKSDPYEGFPTRAVALRLKELTEPHFKEVENEAHRRQKALERLVDEQAPFNRELHLKVQERGQMVQQGLARARLTGDFISLRSRFGVSCWHGSEVESEAMWRLYTALGSGVAIESTAQRLRGALDQPGIDVKRVEYEDFEGQEVSANGPAFMATKRLSYAHEREVRAIMKLAEPGQGEAVPCNLNTLIVQVHISPKADPLFERVVKELCRRHAALKDVPVTKSPLLQGPDYE